MRLIERLQAYLRQAAASTYESVSIRPFTAYIHPTDDLPFFNYAIPDEPVRADVTAALDELADIFRRRRRQPRWEYLEEFDPALAPMLRTAGYVEEARLHLMVCTAATLHMPEPLPDVALSEITAHSSTHDAADFMRAQREGFNPANVEEPGPDEVQQFLRTRRSGGSFLARIGGEPASAGGFSAPHDGIAEIVGIATRPQFRRRGIASALTALATDAAFERGVEIACLTAGDARAGRVYERIGYRPVATTLFYSLPDHDRS